jgi:site-specific DNA-methyltransferase (cytosine-N4-specific)
MKTLLKKPERFYKPSPRPSGHDIALAFGKDNAGAIPSNLLQIPHTNSNFHYLRTCKLLGENSHAAHFPPELPRFFIKFILAPGDVVVDIFSGSNTTGQVAEELQRNWLSIELDRDYAALSAIRFVAGWHEDSIRSTLDEIKQSKVTKISSKIATYQHEDISNQLWIPSLDSEVQSESSR